MKQRAIALIDGEHYPPVVVQALKEAGERFAFQAALFLGGSEKITARDFAEQAAAVYGLPVVFAQDWAAGLNEAIDRYRPEAIVDLSDEPVLGYEERFRLISHSLARNVSYVGSDFQFKPVTSSRLCAVPSLSIVGTAKRVGKTAVSGYAARVLSETVGRSGAGPGVVVVAMGRGGPAEPEVIDGRDQGLGVSQLLAWSRRGRHAASDHFEDAVLSRVVTVGCRRCGGGMAGEPFMSNVAAGARRANELGATLVIFEGSGAAIPPVGTDARLLVAGAHQPERYVTGYLGTYRVLTSDAVVLTMAEPPAASPAKVGRLIKGIGQIKAGLLVVPTVFRPQPSANVAGRRVACFTTAPREQHAHLRRHLEEVWGCRVEFFSGSLSNRAALRAEWARPEMKRVDLVLTEIKAAAIDVVAEEASQRGLEVVFLDNVPEEVAPAEKGQLAEVVQELARQAQERFSKRT
ncbi:MAG: 2,3-diphosphoglycerate synthetase [Thermoleophilia bacterium]|nr:2,3-diphosphoglycerate synthetase [Thermoleophilia bacterium]